jgi:hypothetical protein
MPPFSALIYSTLEFGANMVPDIRIKVLALKCTNVLLIYHLRKLILYGSIFILSVA